MNNIKEKQYKNLVDYYTTENERLNMIIDEVHEVNTNYLTEIFQLENKIQKAIEFIKQDNINVEEEKWVKSEILKNYRYSVKSKLLEILGGE